MASIHVAEIMHPAFKVLRTSRNADIADQVVRSRVVDEVRRRTNAWTIDFFTNETNKTRVFHGG